ncbi:hypothetical protein QA612_05215 [Evansella sp. AB-P1]|uniref:hypothetical protein n=1 Tax=Evansella sp. AB-P1 TaxID=3037653 RepID=UPI00241D186D|nr:hypothetical protein [Evansella sp. AB-P1]MDG5786884.1 hypothetical protein [Evansella sp. AB-P1]
MLSLYELLDSYGFKNGKWKVNGELLETEKGLKRLILWTNEKDARWHIHWRDKLSEKTDCLTNRMIQTIHGERMILCDAGWITLHDEVSSLFPFRSREKEFGAFLGKYFSMEMDEFGVDINDPLLQEESLNYPMKQIGNRIQKSELHFFEAIRKESLIRLAKAKSIQEEHAKVKTPVVAPILSLDQGKLIFEKLYWQHTNHNPERGYRSLRTILSEWLQRYGQSSFFALLNEINNHFPLSQEHGKKLLADCIAPWEFIEFIQHIQTLNDPNEYAVWKEKLTYQWEASRELVKALNKWLDVTREKVKV